MWQKALLVILTFALVSCSEEDPHTIPDTPAGKRFSEIISVINSGDYTTVETYVTDSFSDRYLEEAPVDTQVDFLLRLHVNSTYLEFSQVRSSSEHSIIGSLKNSLMDIYITLGITVEEKSPHKIDEVFLGPSDEASDSANLTDDEVVAQMESFLNRLVDADIFSGTILIARSDNILFQKAYGYASRDPVILNRIDTRFNICSVGKMFTAVAIAQLVEKGEISYEDPVGLYLNSDWVDRDIGEKVKIKHLLTHTSGLGDYMENHQFKEASVSLKSLEDYKPFIVGEQLRFEPGTKWSYSNTGFLLLGVITEKVTGQSYQHYIESNVFRLSGMTGTLDDADFTSSDFAIGYSKEFTVQGMDWKDILDFLEFTIPSPAGGAYLNAEDLHKFSVALRNNALVTEDTKNILMSGKPELNSPLYGFGFEVEKKDGEQVVGHGGSFEGMSAVVNMFLNSEYALIVLSNAGRIAFNIETKFEDLAL